MKCFFSLILALALTAMLCSCGEPPTVNADFSADFAVTQDGTDYRGALTLADGALTVSFTAPYTVAGMTFGYSGEGLTISRGDLGTVVNCDYIPASAAPEVLHNALAYLPQASYAESDESGDHFTLPTPYGDALLTAEDGVPTALSDPHTGMSFTFTPSE